VARESIIDPGDIIMATDSHTCMGGSSNALSWGVGATEYANLIQAGFSFVRVPESIRFELSGRLQPGVTAKDVMLHLLLHYARPQQTLNRVMEFAGPGLQSLSLDERATLTNMATECSAFTGIAEADEVTARWIADRRGNGTAGSVLQNAVHADPGAQYAGGVHQIDLSSIQPMVATPGDPDNGVPSDPTNGALIEDLGDVAIDIAYGGSCTAGKRDDLDFYAAVMREAEAAGCKVAENTEFYLQFGSTDVETYARAQGYLETFERTGVKIIRPGCGACIGCGPGVSNNADQVTVSAINRNFKGRSGPGKLYLASPLTVAASAVTGKITAYRKGMFSA
jgi:3-isopropylmalate/(R)-2-methylmalate dehydratase large subunit